MQTERREDLYMMLNYGHYGGGHTHNHTLDFEIFAYGGGLARSGSVPGQVLDRLPEVQPLFVIRHVCRVAVSVQRYAPFGHFEAFECHAR